MAGEIDMNRFVHRILKSSTASSIACLGKSTSHNAPAVQQLVQQETQHAKILYFGEFHSEPRIISFQTELTKCWAKCLASPKLLTQAHDRPPRLHLIMEHFSVDMQSMLDQYQHQPGAAGDDSHHRQSFSSENEDEAFEELVGAYKNDFGTEGHDLRPYRNLLQFCRQTITRKQRGDGGEQAFCEVHIHGGFIPRYHAARLNKECPDIESKKTFFEEMTKRGYLPKEGDAMYHALFGDNSSFELRGTPEHRLLIQSLMSGTDLYSPSEVEAGHESVEEESPSSRLYQAQLLKDHAMGYRIASLMLDHYQSDDKLTLASDRYIVITGYGHVKHCLGVPDCVKGYLRQEALLHPDNQRRAAALDLLLSISRPPLATESNKFGGNGSVLVGCQMMYEAYLEDSYPPMIEAAKGVSDDDVDDDDDAAARLKQELLKDIFIQHPERLDEYILQSQEVSGPLLNFSNGVAGFEHPCADYLFVYDEDEDNIIDQADVVKASQAKCPFDSRTNSGMKDAKNETAEAYERVGATAGTKGNVARAQAIMTQIGYSDDDISYVGDDDIYNFQGVANPHSVAKIQPGEAVLDIGSGLGIDSFLAMRDCGADKHQPTSEDELSAPFVVGVDLAESEVKHATKRASQRGYSVPQRIQFIRGDIEKIDETFPIPLGKFDVCISNGAFCLVPDKYKAFGNVFRA
ncbi:hypothetical protein ACHAXR_002667, partial [Thalassiosira sp. AJA248-18]